MLQEKETLKSKGTTDNCKCSAIIDGNIDKSGTPSQMSVYRRKKSWHWFIMLGLQMRAVNPSLDVSTPIADIQKMWITVHSLKVAMTSWPQR